MANERTFLAWIRTSIGIMAFGFVVEKFALFINKISYFLGKSHIPEACHHFIRIFVNFWHNPGGVGRRDGRMAFVRYRKVEREIEEDTYRPSLLLDILLTMGIMAIGIFSAILYDS